MKNIAVAGLLIIISGIFSSYNTVSFFTFPNKDSLSSSTGSGLIFPVAGKRPFIGSFWGAVRDGGKRSHEGIDIFARKGTPVLAISDGVVTAVQNGGRGGKTVWLRSLQHLWSAYYAHLDHQKVKAGQLVKKGQVIGTVGNTGNARFTPSHLHFGIYTWEGAINPLPYVKNAPRLAMPPSKVRVSRSVAVKKRTPRLIQQSASIPRVPENDLKGIYRDRYRSKFHSAKPQNVSTRKYDQ